MSHRIATALIAATLFGCAAPESPQTAYNRGVEAYRVNDYAKARVHWTNASVAGDPSAENNLGYLLYYGLGGDADASRAVLLWEKAAYAGHPEAQWHLGHAFEDGTAVPRSNVHAYAWYRCAAANAASAATVDAEIAADARMSLEKLLSKLSSDEFAQGEVLAKQYIEKYAGRHHGT
jgi:TPR repeat protein